MRQTNCSSSTCIRQRLYAAGSVNSEGDGFRVNGRKIWISGALDSRCKICIFMGKSDPAAAPHKQQCMVLVPTAAAGVNVLRPMTVFGQDDAPHGHAEMRFDDVWYDPHAHVGMQA